MKIYFHADTCFNLNILPAYKFFYLKLFWVKHEITIMENMFSMHAKKSSSG